MPSPRNTELRGTCNFLLLQHRPRNAHLDGSQRPMGGQRREGIDAICMGIPSSQGNDRPGLSLLSNPKDKAPPQPELAVERALHACGHSLYAPTVPRTVSVRQ